MFGFPIIALRMILMSFVSSSVRSYTKFYFFGTKKHRWYLKIQPSRCHMQNSGHKTSEKQIWLFRTCQRRKSLSRISPEVLTNKSGSGLIWSDGFREMCVKSRAIDN
ncbi:hypothetical protein NQ318_022455 [Aromia moschata]|uniref:Secreted protein n=1 Tax=Aromia moschata TaxID=1265417 RepID=A0AAV8Z5T7_9CUCU|nr:hypothetical protein NQ318_022455 [Aromia moschata]